MATPVVVHLAAADRAARDGVHDEPVVEEGRPGVLHRVEHHLSLRVGHLPGGALEQREQQPEPAEHHRAVAAGVGHGGVLDERAVGVEAVALGDQREDGGEGVPGQGDLGGGPADDPAQGQHPAQVDPVRPGARAGVRGDRGVGDEVVDGGAVPPELCRGQGVVHQHAHVQQGLGRADLPAVPVPVPRPTGLVDLAVEVFEAGDDRVAQSGAAGQSGALLPVGLGHRVQPDEAVGHLRGEAVRLGVGVRVGVRVHGIRPQRPVSRSHGVQPLPGLTAQGRQPALEGFGGRAEPLAEDQGAPRGTQSGVRIVVSRGGGARRGQHEGAAARGGEHGGGGEERAAGPGRCHG